MIETSVLKQVLLKQKESYGTDLGITRTVKFKPLKRFVSIISGIRRCGNSTYLKQLLAKKKKVYYMHFEDVNLASFESRDFTKLERVFEEVYGKSNVYFFDEIQNVQGWEIYIRSLLEQGKEIYITGSNARMLSKELGTRLTGRHVRKELYPFSFEEFCKARKKKPSLSSFNAYLLSGGMPEYVLQKDERILHELVSDIIFRDILERANINDSKLVQELVSYLLSNCAKPISHTGLAKLHSVGSTSTISLIMKALENAYLIFEVPKFDYSLKKQLRNPRKIYCIDSGFVSKVSFQISPNKGRLLENLVFITLKRLGAEIYYEKEEKECDFVIKKGTKIRQAIQVCHTLTEDNRKREYEGLHEALEKYDLDEGMLLTHDESDEIEIKGKKIIIKPVWKWLLGKS